MSAIVASAAAMVLLFVTQAVVWRLRRPGHYTGLTVLALLVLAASLGTCAWVQASAAGPSLVLPHGWVEYWSFVMLYLTLAVAYMITYSAVQADSPSMSILLMIREAEPHGLTQADLVRRLDDDALIVPRLQDLVIGKLAVRTGDRYVITDSGSRLARIYIGYRRLLKMEKGG